MNELVKFHVCLVGMVTAWIIKEICQDKDVENICREKRNPQLHSHRSGLRLYPRWVNLRKVECEHTSNGFCIKELNEIFNTNLMIKFQKLSTISVMLQCFAKYRNGSIT